MTRYFAYGSNLSLAQMARRCRSSRAVGPAQLVGWKFRIMTRGFATVVPAAGAMVRGLLWNLTPRDETALDDYEGIALGHYEKRILPIVGAVGVPRAMVYVSTLSEAGRPAGDYMERVYNAARDLGFPADYLAELESWKR